MIKVNLVGNPNTGKTTLFNLLTKSHEHVGNWHGVTVEEKAKVYKYKNTEIELVDLPGLYSLSSLSYEEKVAVDNILKDKDRLIVNICDASNLQRNLYLTLGLMELGVNVILAVNQIEKVPICKIDYACLEKTLGLPVIALDASHKEGKDRLNEAIVSFKKRKDYNLPYLKDLRSIFPSQGENDFEKIKLLEGDETLLERVKMQEGWEFCPEKVARARYAYIDQIMQKCISGQTRTYGKSKLDKVLMNRFLAVPIFLSIIALVFYLTFFSIGAFISDGLTFLLDKCIGSPLISLCVRVFGEGTWIVGLVETAIVGGVGTILGFLPQVALLFLFLSLLEDSGYLSRVAFALDDILGKVGLSGKSVYTLLMGFGCSTTAVLTARNMEDKNSKIKTALLTPYMSCSAKFPIYAVLGGAFFGANNIFVILGLYLLGVVIAVSLSYIFEKTVLKSKSQTFILEFPPYHSPSFKRVVSVLWENTFSFLTRVGSLIVAMNVIVWCLGNFSFTLQYIPSVGGQSMLETLGKILAPIFIPLGFGSWGLVSALIAGLVAKEIIVSSIAMFNHVDGASNEVIGQSVKNPASAVFFASASSVISYLVFSLLYFPCLATASVLSKEIGKKWTIISILIELIVAYLSAFVIFNFARAIEVFGAGKVLLTALAIVSILISFIVVVKKIKKKKLCSNCDACKHKCNKKTR